MGKTKKFTFDVEMIIDHEVCVIGMKPVQVSTHRTFNKITLNELNLLIRENNDVPVDEYTKITFNIRGTNYEKVN